MEDFWDGSENDTGESYEEPTFNTSIRVNGSTREVEVGSSFAETIKANALDAGLGKFRVYLNGNEIKPSQSPSVIEEGMHIEVSPYDVAG